MKKTKSPLLISQALGLCMIIVMGLVTLGGPAQAADNYGHQSISYFGVANPPTSDKPQSKLWWNDGTWWADMWTSGSGWHIYRLDRNSNAWVDTGLLNDSRGNTLADTLWDGTKLYIASHVATVSTDSTPTASLSGQPAKLYRYSYSDNEYTLDAGFPTIINDNSSESMTIDQDTTGTVWATWTQVSGDSTSGFTSSVYANYSAAGGTSWGTPFVLPVSDPNPSPDDISAVVAYGKNKIGVMWSDNPAGTVYWATRTDGTSPTAASSWKVQPAVQGKGQADDHINLKALLADSAGRVYAAVKTDLDMTSADITLPQLELLVFKPGTGSFTKSTIATVGDCVTRPQILLDTTNNVVRAFYTAPSTSATDCAFAGVAGSIYEKTASMDDPVFGAGRGTPVIQDGASANINNVTATKQSVNATTGVVVMATNHITKRYWYSDRPLETSPQEWPLYKLAYDSSIYELVTNGDGSQTPIPLTYEKWRDVYNYAQPELASTEYVRYAWSPSIYAVTHWPGGESKWMWAPLSYQQWETAGFPTPSITGWIKGSIYYKWETSSGIFVQGPDGVKHQLSYGEWQASGFQPFETRNNQGFAKLSWSSDIAFMSNLSAGTGHPIGYAEWKNEGFPTPAVYQRITNDTFYRGYGDPTIWYDGPTMNRPITFKEWQAAGFPDPEVRNAP